MIGAIIGDIVGSRFEWHNLKSKDFELFTSACHPTDDSVMTLAVANAFLNCASNYSDLPGRTVECMAALGKHYPRAGYGSSFRTWINSEDHRPYNSFGNGSAMRVSPCAYAAVTLDEALQFAEITAAVTHNHPDGVCGAKAVAGAIFLALHGSGKEQIKAFVEENCYPLNFTLDEIRPAYTFDVSCKGSVPQAIAAFLESSGFEDAVRCAVSIGGDSDTIAAITGSIAEAYYGVPMDIRDQAVQYLDGLQCSILKGFEIRYGTIREEKVEKNPL